MQKHYICSQTQLEDEYYWRLKKDFMNMILNKNYYCRNGQVVSKKDDPELYMLNAPADHQNQFVRNKSM